MKKDWEKIYKEKGELQVIIKKIVREAVPFFKKYRIKRVLDLGAGTGRHTIYLAKRGFDLTATDVAKTGLEIIKRNAKELKLKNIRIKKHDFRKIPFPPNYFDAVVCINVLSKGKIKMIKKVAAEINKVVKKDGIIVVNGPTIKKPDYGQGDEIEPNTFMMWHHEDKDIPHHFFTIKEFLSYFPNFIILRSVTRRKNEWGKKTSYFEMIAKKA